MAVSERGIDHDLVSCLSEGNLIQVKHGVGGSIRRFSARLGRGFKRDGCLVKLSSLLQSPAGLDRRTVLSGVQLALRAGIAAGVAFAFARVLNLNFAIFAAVAAIIVTDLAPSRSRSLGLHRIVATILGAACGGVLSAFLSPQAWAIGAGISIAMLVSSLVHGKDGVRVAGYTCAIVMMNVGGNPWHFALDRLTETLIGVVVAWAVSHIPKLIRLPEPDAPAS